MTKRMTQEEFIAKAEQLHDGKYTYEKTVYTVSAAKILVGCPIHGDFSVTANNHVSKSNLCGCPACGGTKKQSYADFLRAARNIHGDKYDYTQVQYAGTQVPVRIICPQHGEFMQPPTRHTQGRGCHKCGGTKRMCMSEAVTAANVRHNEYYSYELVDLTAKYTDEVNIVCPRHGQYTQVMKYHVSRGWGCPACATRSSVPENEIAEFLSQYTLVERRNRKIIAPKEIDIWLPMYNIGIEYNGIFWHTESRVGNLHRVKWQMAQQANVRLVQIFSDEWEHKKDIVKGRLLAFLGKSVKRDARKLSINYVPWQEAKAFLSVTHLQGAGPAGTAYGLYDKDQLVAVATFGKSRTGSMTGKRKANEYEVLRYASQGLVRGGFSKILKNFVKDNNPHRIISYCDLRYGTGNLYEKAGFALDAITEPDYWWVSNKGKVHRISRYAVQKHKLANPSNPLHEFYTPSKTENQICRDAGLDRILGVGSQRWVWVG